MRKSFRACATSGIKNMVLKFYVSANSPNARLVAVVLHEKKVPFEVIELDFDKDLKSPKYLKLQPFGQEPTIVRIKKTK